MWNSRKARVTEFEFGTFTFLFTAMINLIHPMYICPNYCYTHGPTVDLIFNMPHLKLLPPEMLDEPLIRRPEKLHLKVREVGRPRDLD